MALQGLLVNLQAHGIEAEQKCFWKEAFGGSLLNGMPHAWLGGVANFGQYFDRCSSYSRLVPMSIASNSPTSPCKGCLMYLDPHPEVAYLMQSYWRLHYEAIS
jgi:hypothetical protein